MDESPVWIETGEAGVRLSGSVCRGADVRAAALLLPGSGPQDRDETLCGQASFRELAHWLASHGVASLRCDDRGVGESGGDYLAIDGERLLADAVCQLRRLEAEAPGVPVGVVGHSQGSLFALRLLEAETSVSSGVLLGGGIRSGMEIMLDQRRQLGSDEGLVGEDLEWYVAFSRELFDAIAGPGELADREQRVRELVAASVEGVTDDTIGEGFESVAAYVDYAVGDAMEWEVRELLLSRAVEHLRCVTRPVLALWGEVDRHVSVVEERAAFDGAAPGGCRSRVLEGMNHLFQQSATGALADYTSDGPPMRAPVPALVAGWVTGSDHGSSG